MRLVHAAAYIFAVFIAVITPLVKATTLTDYFTEPVTFNPEIPTPESVLGYQVGDWHVGHAQLVNYMRTLAAKSDRVQLEVMGYSHERRPLLLLTVAHPDKLANIDQIRAKHVALANGGKVSQDAPAVVWMGYSVHGNEASGSNAALLFAYYLAAAQGPQIDKMLNELVVLIDPSLNPDGLDRFASWVNRHQGSVENSDAQNREHNEGWPRGRTNHYWFDLNRDWLLLRHPESRARVAKYHQWKPNVLTDFHEMGANSTFFFQPGISSRKNPWTPTENVTLTKAIAQHHAASFDRQGVLYFTEESFDDFYYGKGSTYPDVNGGVGILFEQASARGFVQQTINGPLRFEQAIKNQLSASLSTLAGAQHNRQQLLAHQSHFFHQALALADKDDISGYILSESYDKTRLHELLGLLQQHQIKAYPLNKDLKANNKQFAAKDSYYIPLAQKQYRLIKSLFSQRKSFENNTFYDVSSWNLAYAFNIAFEPIKSGWGLKYGQTPWSTQAPASFAPLAQSYAYAFAWDDSKAPLLLAKLLNNKIVMRVASKDFSVINNKVKQSFSKGTLVINQGLQTEKNWREVLQKAQQDIGLALTPITSGLTSVGPDLGSRAMAPVNLPKVLIIGGSGASSYEVGEIWHFMNKQMALAPSIIEQRDLAASDLSQYTHIMLSDGRFGDIDESAVKKITRWVKKGGVIWGQKRGAQWLIKKKLLTAKYTSSADMAKRFESEGLGYGERDKLEARQRIAGAIFSVQLDLSHPFSYGYHHTTLPVFKNSTLLLEQSSQPFVTVASYGKLPQLSGYADKVNVDKIAQSGFMLAHSLGDGLVIGVADNVNFRGFWHGTSRLMANSLYFSSLVWTPVD